MNRKWLAALVIIVVLTVSYAVIKFVVVHEKGNSPAAVNGVLDLTGWNFETDGVVALDGQWELYKDQLLTRGVTEAVEPDLIAVPESWAQIMGGTKGIATYKLGIIVQDDELAMGIKTSVIQFSNRILINGKVVGGSGNPADDSSYKAKIKPYAAYFTLQQGYNELLVQVANFDYPVSGGIMSSIFLGASGDIASLKDRANAHGWITISSYLLLGLYFMGLYSRRRNDYSLLFLGIIGVLLALYSSVSGERLIFEYFPGLPVWPYLKFQFGSALLVSIVLLLFVKLFYREYSSTVINRIALAVNILLTVLTLSGFLWQLDTQFHIFNTTLIFTLFYVGYVFVYAALWRVEGSVYLALLVITLSVYTMIQGFANFGSFPQYRLPPFEPFFMLLVVALLMSSKFSNSFRRIEELSVQLMKADKLKDEFISNTSHEFKTPLHGVMNIAASMIEDPEHPPTPKQRERLELMTSITGRLSRLVYDILDFEKLKQGELVMHPEPLDVRSTVEVLLQIFDYIRENRDIRLINQVPENLAAVYADENRFRQIISNLLDNALKYTVQGTIEIGAAERGNQIVLTITDTGVGMSEETMSHIFEPFATINANRGDSFGLGLTIVKQLVELQGGTIMVESVVGEGTSFVVALPSAGRMIKPASNMADGRRPAAVPERSLPTPYHSKPGGIHTVLIADDHYANLKILIDALESMDYTVVAVKDGLEAVKELQRGYKIDMAILDLMMPEMTGFEVCRTIRKTHTLLELPVLMVTAAIESNDKLAAFEAGANDFLQKPFDLTELKARVQSLLLMKESLGKAINMEMAFLQSQIKPHFLFNVLHSIVALSYSDIDKSRLLTNRLADYLRGSFQFANTYKRMPLAAELSLIHAYVDIERVRFKDRIQVHYAIDEEINHVLVPPLLLQPLVENAIRHGLGGRIEGGTVKISGSLAGDVYWFEVRDDGVGIDAERLKQLLDMDQPADSGVGLQNINRRLKYEYGLRLRIESEPGWGTTVTIELPREVV